MITLTIKGMIRTKPATREFIRLIDECGMPLTFGGGIRTLDDAFRIRNGRIN